MRLRRKRRYDEASERPGTKEIQRRKGEEEEEKKGDPEKKMDFEAISQQSALRAPGTWK